MAGPGVRQRAIRSSETTLIYEDAVGLAPIDRDDLCVTDR
jgi:hypothetical protein